MPFPPLALPLPLSLALSRSLCLCLSLSARPSCVGCEAHSSAVLAWARFDCRSVPPVPQIGEPDGGVFHANPDPLCRENTAALVPSRRDGNHNHVSLRRKAVCSMALDGPSPAAAQHCSAATEQHRPQFLTVVVGSPTLVRVCCLQSPEGNTPARKHLGNEPTPVQQLSGGTTVCPAV